MSKSNRSCPVNHDHTKEIDGKQSNDLRSISNRLQRKPRNRVPWCYLAAAFWGLRSDAPQVLEVDVGLGTLLHKRQGPEFGPGLALVSVIAELIDGRGRDHGHRDRDGLRDPRDPSVLRASAIHGRSDRSGGGSSRRLGMAACPNAPQPIGSDCLRLPSNRRPRRSHRPGLAGGLHSEWAGAEVRYRPGSGSMRVLQ